MIKGGYYIKARIIQESEIAHASPCVREIWDFLLLHANHADYKNIKRGQLLCSYQKIQEGLSWSVGYRKESYTKDQCEAAMKWLRSREMITTQKTTRGLIITICKYDVYQTPENYEHHTDIPTNTTIRPQSPSTIYKNEKNGRKKNTGASAPAPAPVLKLVTDIDTKFEAFNNWLKKYAPRILKLSNPFTLAEYHRIQEEFNTESLRKLLQDVLIAMHNWKPLLSKSVSANLTAREWMRKRMIENPSLYEKTENGFNEHQQRQTAREQQGTEAIKSVLG